MITGERGARPRGCGMRPGCSRASTPRCRGSRPAARSPTGSATSSRRELDPGDGRDRARRGGGGLAAGRQGPGRAALFLRRAHADPRSACQGRDLRPRPHPYARRHLPRRCSKASPTAPATSSRPMREAGAAAARDLAVGGGTKNKVWAQATSDVSGRTQIVRDKTVGASYGDAFLAALGGRRRAAARTSATWNPVASRDRAGRRQCRRLRPAIRVFRDSTRAPTT